MRKINLAFIIGYIVCFVAAYQGMVFSPSFTMMYVVAGMGLCILGEMLSMVQAEKWSGSRECIPDKERCIDCERTASKVDSTRKAISKKETIKDQKLISLLSRGLYIFGMFWAFPAVIIYATGDDWMNSCMRAASAGSVVLCGIWLGWMWKTRGIQAAVWGKALELLVSLAAALLAIFCGINSVALMPYGIGLFLITIARMSKDRRNSKTKNDEKTFAGITKREVLFLLGLILIAVFPVVPMLDGIL